MFEILRLSECRRSHSLEKQCRSKEEDDDGPSQLLFSLELTVTRKLVAVSITSETHRKGIKRKNQKNDRTLEKGDEREQNGKT